MKQTKIDIGSIPASYGIVLGRRGETEVAQIIFDVSSLVEQYGNGTAVLMIKRPTDADAYPAVVERDGNNVIWTITDTETANNGSGKCELFWFIGEALAKSIVFRTVVTQDIGEAVSDPPDPYQTWVETLTGLGEKILSHTTKGYTFTDDGEGNITIEEVE